MMAKFIFAFLILLLINKASALQCKNENEEVVDWFYAYKFPIANKKNPNLLIRHGVGYAYITSANPNNWVLSNSGINETNSVIARTLQALYDSENSISDFYHILYNDQPPIGNENAKKGHTKGVLLIEDLKESKTGVWLIHSVPKFPNTDSFNYPSSGTMYGQSFLCISLKEDNLNTIGKLLSMNEIHVYSQNIPNNYKINYSDLYNAANGIPYSDLTQNSLIEKLVILNEAVFIGFAKNRNFGRDLYGDLVAPYYQSTLFVETWPNGPGRMNSSCLNANIKIENVCQVTFDFLAPKTVFKSTHDHSKWALSKDNGIICVGDINRENSQMKRGGGTVCFQNENIASNYKKAIMTLEECSNLIYYN